MNLLRSTSIRIHISPKYCHPNTKLQTPCQNNTECALKKKKWKGNWPNKINKLQASITPCKIKSLWMDLTHMEETAVLKCVQTMNKNLSRVHFPLNNVQYWYVFRLASFFCSCIRGNHDVLCLQNKKLSESVVPVLCWRKHAGKFLLPAEVSSLHLVP